MRPDLSLGQEERNARPHTDEVKDLDISREDFDVLEAPERCLRVNVELLRRRVGQARDARFGVFLGHKE